MELLPRPLFLPPPVRSSSQLNSAGKSNCPDTLAVFYSGSADNELKSIRGWNWGISDGILSINNQRAPVTPPPFPFAALLAGKGFSLDSGLQSAAVMGTNGPGSAQVTDRLLVSFSPAAKR